MNGCGCGKQSGGMLAGMGQDSMGVNAIIRCACVRARACVCECVFVLGLVFVLVLV